MVKRGFPVLIVVFLITLIGCMSCENSPGTTDVTADRAILTGTVWVAQEHYEVTFESDDVVYHTLVITPMGDSTDLFTVVVYPTDAQESPSAQARITYTGDVPLFQSNPLGDCSLRITNTELGGNVLSLTLADTTQFYFSPLEGGE